MIKKYLLLCFGLIYFSIVLPGTINVQVVIPGFQGRPEPCVMHFDYGEITYQNYFNKISKTLTSQGYNIAPGAVIEFIYNGRHIQSTDEGTFNIVDLQKKKGGHIKLPAGTTFSPKQINSSHHSNLIWYLIGGAAIVVVGLGGYYYYLIKNKKNKKTRN